MKIAKFISHNREISAGLLIIMIVTLSVLVVSNHSPKSVIEELEQPAKFVLASWDYPDEYGQGIRNVAMEQYTNGAWVALTDPSPPKGYYYSPSEFNITDGEGSNGSIWMLVQCYLNGTVCGINDINDGPPIIRHTLTVTSPDNSSVFYQENFTLTYQTDAFAPMYFYQYDVYTDFTPNDGIIYTAVITYEIYYEVIEEEYLHDCSSVSGITYSGNSHLGDNDYGIGSNGSSVEFWILPDDGFGEGVFYKIDFTNFNNTDGNTNITVRYKVEGATNFFYYRVVYDDVSFSTSDSGTSTSWDTLNMTPDTGKILDYIYIFNYDTPSATASGNLSVWIDYIEIYSSVTDWNDAGEAKFYFSVPYDMWGYNTGLIILGLIMIPISTIYLAYGVKHDRSSERLFYGLIIFMVGCGLFIGGIMP